MSSGGVGGLRDFLPPIVLVPPRPPLISPQSGAGAGGGTPAVPPVHGEAEAPAAPRGECRGGIREGGSGGGEGRGRAGGWAGGREGSGKGSPLRRHRRESLRAGERDVREGGSQGRARVGRGSPSARAAELEPRLWGAPRVPRIGGGGGGRRGRCPREAAAGGQGTFGVRCSCHLYIYSDSSHLPGVGHGVAAAEPPQPGWVLRFGGVRVLFAAEFWGGLVRPPALRVPETPGDGRGSREAPTCGDGAGYGDPSLCRGALP